MLRLGDEGPAVLALQERLDALGFWLGEPDGVFGDLTQHAVTAFQKANGLDRDGIAGPQTRRTLRSADRPAARSEAGRVVEVDLERQLLLVVVDGEAEHVFDASTGEVPGTTPAGEYEVFRQVDGYDTGPLGTLYRPKYFNGGVAVHGYPSVPPYPASHGCVRVVNPAMDWLWSSGELAIGQPVWVY
jgi:peptidoglycan hydrolase-like protein with peptidoglycan-binding domain